MIYCRQKVWQYFIFTQWFMYVVQNMLRCGQTDVYIKPECVCSFYNVYEATLFHKYSSCPDGAESDIVTQLKCKYKWDRKSNLS